MHLCPIYTDTDVLSIGTTLGPYNASVCVTNSCLFWFVQCTSLLILTASNLSFSPASRLFLLHQGQETSRVKTDRRKNTTWRRANSPCWRELQSRETLVWTSFVVFSTSSTLSEVIIHPGHNAPPPPPPLEFTDQRTKLVNPRPALIFHPPFPRDPVGDLYHQNWNLNDRHPHPLYKDIKIILSLLKLIRAQQCLLFLPTTDVFWVQAPKMS